MYACALEQEGLSCSWPSFPSAQFPMSTSSLSPALPGAVSVHVGGVMEQGRKPVEEGETYIRVLLRVHCVFAGFSLHRVNLTCPALDGGRWGEEPGSGAVCVRALLPAQAVRPVPWCWSGLDALWQVTQHSPDDLPTTDSNSEAFPRAQPRLGPRHPSLSSEGRIPAQHRTTRKLGLADG